jgi:hypothetical protein
VEQYHRATAEQFITAKHLEQYHSYNVEQLSQQNRYNSYHSYNVQQQSRYNSYNLERYHSKTAITAKQLSQIKQSNRTTALNYFCNME